jgi:hypothetical protein
VRYLRIHEQAFLAVLLWRVKLLTALFLTQHDFWREPCKQALKNTRPCTERQSLSDNTSSKEFV